MKNSCEKSHNYFLIEQQLKCRTTFVLGMPNTLIIEPGAVCSLHCRFCPQSKSDFDFSRDLLSFADFKKIIRQFEPYLDTILLFNWGEPLMNPEITKMIRFAADKSIRSLLHSHLNILDSAKAESLVASGLFELVASIDGASQATYALYREGGSFERAIANLRLLQEKKKKLKSDTPRLVWKFLVFRHNQEEMESARLMAQDLGVEIEFKLAVTDGTLSSTLEEYSSENLPGKFIKHYGLPCEQLWRAPVIHSDGMVLPCCMISSARYSVGNLFREDFREIWNNAAYRRIREAASGKVDPDESVFCYYCMFGSRQRKGGINA